MTLLDTHIWIWWVHGDPQLPKEQFDHLVAVKPKGLSVSAISCWEVAKLVELGRLDLKVDIAQWFDKALDESGIGLVPLTPQIAAESCFLPGSFHRDPADRIIVATARILDCTLITLDAKICGYPHVSTNPPAKSSTSNGQQALPDGTET